MKRALLFAGVAAILLSKPASAQVDPERARDPYLAAELRFGPYRPNVDEGPVRGNPYNTAFGDTRRFMFGAEIDWQAIHMKHFGSLGLGGMFGYTRATANALFVDDNTESGEDTTFSLWLFSALAVLRVDVLAKETWIPIVPYVKAGPGLGLWASGNASGTVRVDGVDGKGRTYGMVYAFGGMFLLDAIDRESAKRFAAEQGVQHSYFFFEYTMAEMKGLGQTNAMWVGDRTWTLGLAMEL